MKICFVSGKRGGYGAMEPTLAELRKAHEVKVCLWDQHGDAQKWGDQGGSGRLLGSAEGPREVGLLDQAKVFAGLCGEFDLVLVLGDRLESLLTASVAHEFNVPVAHVEGGDVSGGVDESYRHAITKLAHLHFCSNEEALGRILRLGEEEWRVHVVGDVHIDRLMIARGKPVPERFGVKAGEYALLLQHPDSLAPELSGQQIAETLIALRAWGGPVIASYPCSDRGHEAIIRNLDAAFSDYFQVHKNIPHGEFIALLEHAAFMIGNSSSGVKEAAYLGTPAVNLGDRQQGRPSAAVNAPFEAEAITAAIKAALASGVPVPPDYGDGLAYKRIAAALGNLPAREALLRKRWSE